MLSPLFQGRIKDNQTQSLIQNRVNDEFFEIFFRTISLSLCSCKEITVGMIVTCQTQNENEESDHGNECVQQAVNLGTVVFTKDHPY